MQPNPHEASKTLWVGDLDSYMDEPFLQSLLNAFGYSKDLSSIKIIRDKSTGQPLKYGFLEFLTHQSANNFYLNYNNRSIPNTNKLFKLNWATYGGAKAGTQGKVSQETQIYVGEIDSSATEHKLLEFFRSKYSSAFSAKIITDTATKLSKGYGFVKFANLEQSYRAIAEMNGQPFLGKNIKASTAHMKNKQEAQQDNQELEGQLILRQKLYNQFYSINDPVMKAEYQKQLLKTFGSDQNKKASLKQSLGDVRGLSYSQSKESEKLLEVIPRAVHNSCRYATEEKIYL